MGLFDGLLDDDTEKMNNYTEPTKKEERAPEGETDPETNILLRHLDPRPDIKFDHLDWGDMLQNCLVWDGLQDGEKLWGVLHGLRCGGARVQRVPKSEMGFKLLPGNEDWKKDADWQRVRKEYLDPVKEDLISLFKMTKVHGRLPRMEEIWPEAGDMETEQVVQEKLF